MTQQERCPMNHSTPDCKQKTRPHRGLCALSKYLLLSKVPSTMLRATEEGEKRGFPQRGPKDQAEMNVCPQFQTSPLPPRPSPATIPLQGHLEAHCPPRHLFIREAGSEGKTTVQVPEPKLPLHRAAQHREQRDLQSSSSRKKQKAQMSHLLVFPSVLPSALGPTRPLCLFPAFHTTHPTPEPPGGLSLLVLLNPHESLITDLHPDTKRMTNRESQMAIGSLGLANRALPPF